MRGKEESGWESVLFKRLGKPSCKRMTFDTQTPICTRRANIIRQYRHDSFCSFAGTRTNFLDQLHVSSFCTLQKLIFRVRALTRGERTVLEKLLHRLGRHLIKINVCYSSNFTNNQMRRKPQVDGNTDSWETLLKQIDALTCAALVPSNATMLGSAP